MMFEEIVFLQLSFSEVTKSIYYAVLVLVVFKTFKIGYTLIFGVQHDLQSPMQGKLRF
jgi:hypothetical protein